MQVDPQSQPLLVTAPASGGGLTLEPGRHVVARVLEVDDRGGVRISLAGHNISVSANIEVRHGDTLHLTVGNVDRGRVTLNVDSHNSAPPPQRDLPGASRYLSEVAPNAIRELARAGVPVTPQLAQAVSRAVEGLVSGSGGTSVENAARAIANLVSRDYALNPAAAGRVATALDMAGRLGDQISQLAKVSPEIASALPGSMPGAAALRALLSSSLSPAELAIARIVQAQATAQALQASAPGGPVTLPTPPSSSPAVIANYVASQVAVTARLDALAQANFAGAQPATAATPTGAPVNVAENASLAAIRQSAAAVRGEAAAPGAGLVRPETTVLNATQAASQSAQAQANAASQKGATSAGSAVVGSTPSPTPPAVAAVVADLSIAVTRFTGALAQSQGAPGAANAALAKQMSATEGQAPAGTFTPQAAGGSASGAPAPLIAAMREALLGSQTAQAQEQSTRALMQALSNASSAQIQSALRQLPESQSLQLAGRLLDMMPNGAMTAQQAADMRHSIHNILGDLGRALQPGAHDDQAVLRAALEHVANHDPRPAVADQATKLLHAMEGQQLLSSTRAGADPGYVYFQLPLPGNRSAEVIVRREPGRREVSFDHFDIAFLLDTEAMGSLLIHLDAHPGAVRAMIKTEIPALEPFLAAQAEALREPVEREARRPLTVSTGVFEPDAVPTSLLEPELGLVPGENSYYA